MSRIHRQGLHRRYRCRPGSRNYLIRGNRRLVRGRNFRRWHHRSPRHQSQFCFHWESERPMSRMHPRPFHHQCRRPVVSMLQPCSETRGYVQRQERYWQHCLRRRRSPRWIRRHLMIWLPRTCRRILHRRYPGPVESIDRYPHCTGRHVHDRA